jgi:transcriptional regulator with GAF, ATPase, and Fis domain
VLRLRSARPEPVEGRAWGERSPRLDDLTLAEAEAVLIRRALARAHGDWRWAAAALGLSPFDFRQRVRRHGLA